MNRMPKVYGYAWFFRCFLSMLMLSVLMGCKTELYTGLTEKEGNEMLSILLEQGIDADKIAAQKGQAVTLMVSKDNLSQAIQVLKSQGYPRDKFSSVGELFQKDGLISSPQEEKARYIYGLSQEISATLSQLDGVITARVHIVMPELDRKKSQASSKGALKISSASVFIKHANTVKLDDFVPQIKMLVNNSIEGLSYDNTYVALFPTEVVSNEVKQKDMIKLAGIEMAKDSVTGFYILIGSMSFLLMMAIVCCVFMYLRFNKRSTQLSTT